MYPKLPFTFYIMKSYTKTIILIVILLPSLLFSQQYRNINAYMDDFDRNETFLKRTLNDFSASLANNNLDKRTEATSLRITSKLKRINLILANNDKGFEGNTHLRDSFIEMSNKTIECLNNGSLTLDDYAEMSKLSIKEIKDKLNFKENNLKEYYSKVLKYENAKKEFSELFNIEIKYITDNKILEYNAKENFAFYKVNVADEKFINAVNENNFEEASMSLEFLKTLCNETTQEVNSFAENITDKSLNNANLTMIKKIEEINSTLFSYYIQFNKMSKILVTIKNDVTTNPGSVTSEEYNGFIKNYNAVKDIYSNAYQNIQNDKKNLIDKWQISNSSFLKRNIKFDDYGTGYAQED